MIACGGVSWSITSRTPIRLIAATSSSGITPQAPTLMSAACSGTCGHSTVRMRGGAPGPANVATRIGCPAIVSPPRSECYLVAALEGEDLARLVGRGDGEAKPLDDLPRA